MPESVTPSDPNDVDPLTERLRASVEAQADALADAPDLPGRIHARVRRRRRQRAAAGSGVFVFAVVAMLAGALVLVPEDDSEDLHTAAAGTGSGPPHQTTTTEPGKDLGNVIATMPSTTRDEDETQATRPPREDPPEASSTTMVEPPPADVLVGADTPLTFAGVGPIRAGMTVGQAEEAAGVTINLSASLGEGSTCNTGQIGNSGIWVIVETSGAADADPAAGVVQVVQGGMSTEEGVYLGDAGNQVEALYGSPSETIENPYVEGGQVRVYVRDSYAYGLTVDADNLVTDMQSGSAAWVPVLEGCA